MNPTENKKNLWKYVDEDKYQRHVTISTIDSTTESSEEADDKIVYMEDLEKRKQVYGICGECNEPGTGEDWCQPYFLNEIKSHLQIYLNDIVQCYGITQDPETNEYMMVLQYCEEPANSAFLTECLDIQFDEFDFDKEI
ncbi:kinase-like domain-containing protein [Rhizophagus irregularis DAOM 181602=DAOM 197198]|nr:kinase-like domain-containing protein [Rhizophagus irregularis DAOM 181602=DAOM 197198]